MSGDEAEKGNSKEEKESKLIQRRTVAKSSLTKIKTFVYKFDITNDDISGITVRSRKIQSVWEKYDETQSQLEEINWNKHSPDRDEIEQTYDEVSTEIERLIQMCKKKEDESNRTAMQPAAQTIVQNKTQEEMPQVPLQDFSKLIANAISKKSIPTFEIKKFTGNYEDYRAFIDLFDSMIHEDESIPQIQKFYHLKSALTGEAGKLIENLSMTEANYIVARTMLRDRYNHEPFILNAHLRALFELPTISKEVVSDLRKLITTTKQELQAIQNMSINVTSWDHMIIYLLKTKLDQHTRKQWQLTQKDPKKFPTLNNFYEFLEQRCFALEAAQMHSQQREIRGKSTTSKVLVVSEQLRDKSCPLCKGAHHLFQCDTFKRENNDQRFQHVKNFNVCFNCLRPGHSARRCEAGKCRKCNRTHHTLLHKDMLQNTEQMSNTNQTPQHDDTENTSQVRDQVTNQTTLTNYIANQNYYTLLPTAEIILKGKQESYKVCKTLLDSGSQSNFITSSLVKTLRLKTIPVEVNISGITSSTFRISQKTNVIMMSRDRKFQRSLSCLVIPRITDNLPGISLSKEELGIPDDVQLADPSFHVKSPIDLLIGSDTFWSLLQPCRIELNNKQLILQNTTLGYIVAGKTPQLYSNSNATCDLVISSIHEQIERFWRIEETTSKKYLTSEEKRCEEHFVDNYTREPDGRFTVRLPFKSDISQLGDSLQGATQRLIGMEKKKHNDHNLSCAYTKFMNEYTDLGHMTKLTRDFDSKPCYYLPHHAVFKHESTTTNVRVVFDASFKTTTNISLNDLLMVGPKIQHDSWDILLRFRQHKYVVSADIAKMYRQIWVHESDRSVQRILWRQNPNQPIETYELNTVTYGMASCSFLAVRCLHQLAYDHSEEFPQTSKIILEDFYVDDVLTGGNTVKELKQRKTELKNILCSGGFELRKWKANNESLLDETDEIEKISSGDIPLFVADSAVPKTLGLRWNPHDDNITYQVKEGSKTATTKRQILSEIAKLYDPLGLISPIIITAKIIMQKLWLSATTWDENVPNDIMQEWTSFQDDLPKLKNLLIPRWACLPEHLRIELHAFADASTSAYGTSVYIRTSDNLGNYKSRLICSKSRVAPLKVISVPRLELCAAVLAAHVAKKVREALYLPEDVCTFWTDSTIVLCWIYEEPSKLQTFIANRVSDIQQSSGKAKWRHVSGRENPADIVSRGMNAEDLMKSSLWWKGPSFLEQPDSTWAQTPELRKLDPITLEYKKTTVLINQATLTSSGFQDIISRFSNWNHLIRTLTHCMRFCKKLKGESCEAGPLKSKELTESTLRIVRIVQRESFQSEYQVLKSKNKHLRKRSKLRLLHPFIKDGMIRVGGRLQNAAISEDHKHPILLPANHAITMMILNYVHRKYLHCGAEQLLSIVRLKFWPLAGRTLAKRTVSKCTACFAFNPSRSTYIMGNLPNNRVQLPLRPFTAVGVDYAGPITLRESRRRGRITTTKAYIAVFVCFSTKAVHLELVSSLSTEGFMSALRRFTSRRGTPKTIRSDNGTNFVGANRELQEIYSFLKTNGNEISEECGTLRINWEFNPPSAPNFGGLWEAAVKSFKRHFYKVTHGHKLTFEECYTLLTQIEATLNSRPLLPLSSDPNDYNILTPAHFLIGDTLLEPPDYDYTTTQTNKLNLHKHLQQIRQQFWKRWQQEYLHTLQTRCKWQTPNSNTIQVNDLVLIVDDKAPPLHWCRGRILQTHPGNDGVMRVVTVKTSKGVYKRPVSKICVLPKNSY